MGKPPPDLRDDQEGRTPVLVPDTPTKRRSSVTLGTSIVREVRPASVAVPGSEHSPGSLGLRATLLPGLQHHARVAE